MKKALLLLILLTSSFCFSQQQNVTFSADPSTFNEATDPKNQINCSMDIMKEILKGRKGMYHGNGRIFPTNSYWEKLRPNHSGNGGPIGNLVRQFPPCKATP